MQPDFKEIVQARIDEGQSRAVITEAVAGEREDCQSCGEPVQFKAKERQYRVLCNVYVENVWDHMETFHPVCYINTNVPHGQLIDGAVRTTPDVKRFVGLAKKAVAQQVSTVTN